ncbi:hypothetical protein GCM10008995_07700 [Halobellus salinus]|uniref:ACP synthase n=1 Tax=Halobellus salinus TaxID=931585 RepID=A0A830E8P2_9EURY|nr:zinc ribbon domain-containing protein [Halobellus salinus]GGJ00324.1 hypothetical protein GCM10008995_07700 [Halobellus salinus]SMP01685.1 hypothetical protein SAMN06265347_101138 [Halobellus salinus]
MTGAGNGTGRGIAATGLYLPRQRLDGAEIQAAWGAAAPVDRAAVPAADEDALTMAVAAGRDALSSGDLAAADIAHLAVATTTPPLEEEAFAPRIGAALGLDSAVSTTTATQSTAAGGEALLSGVDSDGPALVVVADAPEGDAAAVGQRVGAGAAAFLVDDDADVVLTDRTRESRDAPGLRLRERGRTEVSELDITTYERTTIRDVVSTALDRLAIDHGTVDAVSLYQPTGDIPHRIGTALPYDGGAIDRGTVVDDVGDAGAAAVAIGLLAALEAVDPDSTVIAGFFGSGATAVGLGFEVATAPETGVTAAIEAGEEVPYPAALRARGTIGETEVAGGGAHVSLPSWQRTTPQRYRLAAGRCPDCGAVAFPPEGACPACGAREDYELTPLSRTGEVAAVTVIGQGGAPPEFVEQQRRDGPFAVAIVESTAIDGDGSARFPAQLTDCDPGSVSVGDAVTGRLRRIYTVEGVTRYGLKFVPE